MANAAANSSRANLILDPYPSIVDPDNPHRLAMDPKVPGGTQFQTGSNVMVNGICAFHMTGQRVQCCNTSVERSCQVSRRLAGVFTIVECTVVELILIPQRGRTPNLEQELDYQNKLCFPLMQW